jgi:chemotaxis protein methyltransferase CheR
MISHADYRYLADLLLVNSGFGVGEGKEYLVESRLLPVAHRLGHADLQGLVDRLRIRLDPEVVRLVCEAMATNETSFFRDQIPFDVLQSRLLPELIRRNSEVRELRIWCAAASFGQEPYSVAMLLDDLALADWKIEIIATDFSRPALQRARTAVYTTFELQRGLSADQRARFFVPHGPDWRLRDSTRGRVTFGELNLIHSFGNLGTFDLILCRNVLIYFDLRIKRDVLERMAACLSPTGYLLLGAAESAIGITEEITRVGELPTSVYRKAPAPQRRYATV